MTRDAAISRSAFRLRSAAACCVGAWLVVAVATSTSRAQVTAPAAVQQLQQAVARAVERQSPSVVAIALDRRRRGVERLGPAFDVSPSGLRRAAPDRPDFVPAYFGAGVVIDRRGLILTNYHVLGQENDDYTIDYFVTTADGKIYPAKIKASDPRSDLAVLELALPPAAGKQPDGRPPQIDLTPIEFGDGEKLSRGQFVIALGNPYAIARDGQASAGWGLVANLARKGPAPVESEFADPQPRATLHHFGTLIQTDVRVSLGASGGALLDLDGRLVGLTSAWAAHVGYETSAGFAIPVNPLFRRVVETLAQGKEVEYGFLGIAPATLSADEVQAGDQGVRVERVIRGAPAERMGLRRGDLITHVEQTPIEDADGLILNVTQHPPGRAVRLAVVREGAKREVAVTLTKYAPLPGGVVTERLPAWRGLRVDYPTAVFDVRQLVEIPPGCVAVAEVQPDSPAWKLGLRRETLITRVAGQPVDTPETFRRLVAAQSGAVELDLQPPQAAPQKVKLDDR